jgi:hypothetical protein
MAITVTPTYANPSNTAKNVTFAEGVSETAGTAETFETVFPASDETCCIMVKNGNTATVQVKLLAAKENNGFSEVNHTLAKNGMCVFSIESGFVKNADGKVCVKVTPNSATTVKTCGVGVAAVCSGVTTA